VRVTPVLGCVEWYVADLDAIGGGAPQWPLVRPGERAPAEGSALELAERAVAAGVRALLVLDLARVGTGMGLDLELVRQVRRALPDVELLAGGGVAGPADLARLAAAGCVAVLVATALHDGRLTASDLRRHPNDSR